MPHRPVVLGHSTMSAMSAAASSMMPPTQNQVRGPFSVPLGTYLSIYLPIYLFGSSYFEHEVPAGGWVLMKSWSKAL